MGNPPPAGASRKIRLPHYLRWESTFNVPESRPFTAPLAPGFYSSYIRHFCNLFTTYTSFASSTTGQTVMSSFSLAAHFKNITSDEILEIALSRSSGYKSKSRSWSDMGADLQGQTCFTGSIY
jgi:hypothetical protein